METIVTINGCFHGCFTYLLMDVLSRVVIQRVEIFLAYHENLVQICCRKSAATETFTSIAK